MWDRLPRLLAELRLPAESRVGIALPDAAPGPHQAWVLRAADEPLPSAPVSVLFLPRGVYEGTSGRSARVALLRRCLGALAQRGQLVVDVRATEDGALPGHLVVDGLRRVIARLGVRTAEEGDRSDGLHRFFRTEDVTGEAYEAGFALGHRRWDRFVLEPGAASAPHAPAARGELGAVLRVLPPVERLLRGRSPEESIAGARAVGRSASLRGPEDRRSLRWAVAWVDAFAPGHPGCFRRTLLEVAADAGAAREPVLLGLDVGRTGHAWLESAAPEQRPYDVTFKLLP
ncbi:MAG: hypothetical protein HOO96_11900 [Polyangiaceae bacterium]|nr:hypothetical protein [Polyangiaceae bacterium]